MAMVAMRGPTFQRFALLKQGRHGVDQRGVLHHHRGGVGARTRLEPTEFIGGMITFCDAFSFGSLDGHPLTTTSLYLVETVLTV